MADVKNLMNSELYKPNSHKAKAERAKELPPKDIQKVVTGSVKSKDQSMVKRMTKNVLADDMSNVKNYIILDVLIPTIKDAVVNIVSNGISMLVYGDVKPSGSKFNYNGVSKKSSIVSGAYKTPNRRATHDFRDVKFETRGDAMEVLSNMNELIETYGNCTVEDFYKFIGEGETAKYTDRNWGWTQLGARDINRVMGGGYAIDLPRVEHLD